MKTITSIGNGSNFITSALMGMGGTQQDKNGRFFLDGNMVHVELSRVIAEAIYIGRIFRNGQSVNMKYTTDTKPNGATRVPIDVPLPFSSRTTSYGGRPGTPNNGGLINVNGAIMPGEDEFVVYRNQVNDQILYFPDLRMQYIPLELMSRKLAGYADRVQMDRDGSTMAEFLAMLMNGFRGRMGTQEEDISTQGQAPDFARRAVRESAALGLIDENTALNGPVKRKEAAGMVRRLAL